MKLKYFVETTQTMGWMTTGYAQNIVRMWFPTYEEMQEYAEHLESNPENNPYDSIVRHCPPNHLDV